MRCACGLARGLQACNRRAAALARALHKCNRRAVGSQSGQHAGAAGPLDRQGEGVPPRGGIPHRPYGILRSLIGDAAARRAVAYVVDPTCPAAGRWYTGSMEHVRRQYTGLGTTLYTYGNGDVISVADSGFGTYRDGYWCWWPWPAPPEDVRLQVVTLAHERRWSELDVLVALLGAL